MVSFSRRNSTRSMKGSGCPTYSGERSPASASPGAPSLGYVAPGAFHSGCRTPYQFGFFSSTI